MKFPVLSDLPLEYRGIGITSRSAYMQWRFKPNAKLLWFDVVRYAKEIDLFGVKKRINVFRFCKWDYIEVFAGFFENLGPDDPMNYRNITGDKRTIRWYMHNVRTHSDLMKHIKDISEEAFNKYASRVQDKNLFKGKKIYA